MECFILIIWKFLLSGNYITAVDILPEEFTEFTNDCVVPENIHIPPTEGFLFCTPHPPGNSSLASYFASKSWLLWPLPHPPRNFQWPSVRRVWTLSGTTHNVPLYHYWYWFNSDYSKPNDLKLIIFNYAFLDCRETWLGLMTCCTLPICVLALVASQNMCCGVKAGKPRVSASLWKVYKYINYTR